MKKYKIKHFNTGGQMGTTVGTAVGSFIPVPGASAITGAIGGMMGSRLGRKKTRTPIDVGTTTFKYGGKMKKKYAVGGTVPIGEGAVKYQGSQHEQGGIPIGPTGRVNKTDPVAEVEGGETRQGDYIFSDELIVPGTDLTFAEAHEIILQEGGSKEEIQQLQQIQEQVKQQEGLGEGQPQMPEEGLMEQPEGSPAGRPSLHMGQEGMFQTGGYLSSAKGRYPATYPAKSTAQGGATRSPVPRLLSQANRNASSTYGVRKPPVSTSAPRGKVGAGKVRGLGIPLTLLSIVGSGAYNALQRARERGQILAETGIHPNQKSVLQSHYGTSPKQRMEGFIDEVGINNPIPEPIVGRENTSVPDRKKETQKTRTQSTKTQPAKRRPAKRQPVKEPTYEPIEEPIRFDRGREVEGRMIARKGGKLPKYDGGGPLARGLKKTKPNFFRKVGTQRTSVAGSALKVNTTTGRKNNTLLHASRALPALTQAGFALTAPRPERTPRAIAERESPQTGIFSDARRNLAGGFRSTRGGQGEFARYTGGVNQLAAQEAAHRGEVESRNIQRRERASAENRQAQMRDSELSAQHTATRAGLLMDALQTPIEHYAADRQAEKASEQEELLAIYNIPTEGGRINAAYQMYIRRGFSKEEARRLAGKNFSDEMRKGGKIKQKNFGNPLEFEAMSKVLTHRNRNLNWVERGLNPDKYPKIDNKDGSFSTHRLEYATGDKGEAYVYPTIIQKEDGTLKQMDSRKAMDYAFKTKTAMQIPNIKLAEYYSQNGLIKH